MIFYFNLKGDSLILSDYKTDAKTGNVNSYTCKFQSDFDWDDLKVFASFKSGETVYTVELPEDFTCTIPHELLSDTGEISVGIYGTNFSEDNLKRISTNWVTLTISDGAYRENSTSPVIPTPDFWEELTLKTVPKIGENGNWFIWDMTLEDYRDTGISSKSEIDNEFSENSKNPLANDIITKKFREIDENYIQKDMSDSRYLFKNTLSKERDFIEDVSDYIPNAPILDFKVFGDSYYDEDPILAEPQQVYSVGDIVSDISDENFGKFHVDCTFNDKKIHLYLNTPLRGLNYYGTSSNNLIGIYDLFADYIDYSNRCVVRNVGKITIDDISETTNEGNICYIKNNKLCIRTYLNIPDMRTYHPSGRWVLSDVLSNRLQTYKKSSSSILSTDNYIMTENESNNLYFYWDLNILGFSFEECDSSDYFLETPAGIYYKVKDQNYEYLTDISQIISRINELYSGESIKIYYPLESPIYESLDIPEIFMPDSGSFNFIVNTDTTPRELRLCYYADISKTFNKINERLDDLESAILSLGANIS